jgi:hypothetical protein
LAGGGTVRVSVSADGSKLEIECTAATPNEVTV